MGQSPTSDTYNKRGNGLAFFQGKAEFGEIYPTVEKYCSAPNKIALAGATLLSVRAPVGPTNLAKEKCCIGRGLAAVHPAGAIDPMFILYLLRSVESDLSKEGTGSTFSAINKKFVEELEFGLPPLGEQYRIVAKIEELFSELDKGIESLKTAQAQLRAYRQALLKHAFEGKLTAQWRADNPDKRETADALLKRIQKEREQRYQQQLAEWEAVGKPSSKPKAPKLLAPLSTDEVAELPKLPEGWGWSKLGQIFGVYVGSTPSRKQAAFWFGDIPWVSSGEVAFCRIKETREKISKLGYENASTEIHPIGTVMLAMIGEGKTRGQPAILDIQATHNQNTAAIRVSESGCSPEFVYQYLAYQYEMTRKKGSGNNQKALNKERVSELSFPLCCVTEMLAIAQILDEKLSEADQLDQVISTALQQSEALRQSLLKKAFSGQLVPQDPTDEPAAALLARIKAEPSAAPKAKKTHLARTGATQ